jgi:hypothetical protein
LLDVNHQQDLPKVRKIHEFLTEKIMSIICQMHAVKIWPQIAIFAGIFAVEFRILELFHS